MEDAPSPAITTRLSAQVEAIVSKRIANDQLVLPALPAVATKCLGLLRNADFSLRDAAAIIETDPVLAVKLLKLANSAAYGGRDATKTITAAVTRIGLQGLRTFLIESSARKLFSSPDRRIADASAALWTHSVAVAVVARDLMTICGGAEPDMAYLGGLLHDVGKPIVAAILLDAERSVSESKRPPSWISSSDWVAVVQDCHRRVGVALTEKWEMPPTVRAAVRDCEEFDNSDRLCAANVVRFANALVKQKGLYVGKVDKEDVDALVMIGRSLLNLEDGAVGRATAGLARIHELL